jgi:hypothetical protein
MRTLTLAFLLMGVSGLATGCTLISQPSPSPSPVTVTGRVEVPTYGFALTVPDDWVIDPLGAPEYGEADPDLGPSSVLYAWHGPQDVQAHRCDMWVDASMQPPATLADYAQQRVRDFERDRDISGESAPVELPAGHGMRTTLSYDYEFVLGHSEYILARDGVFYTLACIGKDPPEDRWLSIAETWEWLPIVAAATAEPSPTPA